jgi:hypothetical protein
MANELRKKRYCGHVSCMEGGEKINYYHDVDDKLDRTVIGEGGEGTSRIRSTFYLNNIIGKNKS